MTTERTPGPCHAHDAIHYQSFRKMEFPEGCELEFGIEFGKVGEDWGGFFVCGFNGYGPEYQPEVWRRLITAAPELLEACKASVAGITGGSLFPESLRPERPLEMLKAAIAKAETA